MKKMKFEIKIHDNETKEEWVWYREYARWVYAEKFGLRMKDYLKELDAISEDWVVECTRLKDTSIVFTN